MAAGVLRGAGTAAMRTSITHTLNVLEQAPRSSSFFSSSAETRGELRVGWWDEANGKWNEDGITEIEHNEETSSISFKTVRITELGFLQQLLKS